MSLSCGEVWRLVVQGDSRKRRAPTAGQKSKKKSRVTKVLNTHLDSTLLKDYSETAGKAS